MAHIILFVEPDLVFEALLENWAFWRLNFLEAFFSLLDFLLNL